MGRNSFKVLEPDQPEEPDEMQEAHVRAVQEENKVGIQNKKGKKARDWAMMGVGDIIVDSAADESCWPKDEGGAFPTRPSKRRIILKAANGTDTQHYGEKKVTFAGAEGGEVVGLTFQVTDVQKPLLAVRRLVEHGCVVKFGSKDEDNFIHNVISGAKIPLMRKGGSFVIKARFMKDLGEQSEVFTRQAR